MRKNPRLLLLLLILTLALAARLIPGPRTIDDSYITFRYARNLLAGDGLVYNPGERVMGTTTLLYTSLMAGLGALAGGPRADFPVIAWIVNALADALTCLLLWRIGRRIGAEFAGAAAALGWAVAPFSVTFAIGGLETSVYVLLLTALAAAYLEGRLALAALCAGLALVTRPDALILIGPFFLDAAWRAWRSPSERPRPAAAAAFLLPVLAWIIFTTLYYGSPVPHSVQAKLGAYRLESTEALVRLIQHYATPFLTDVWVGPAAAVAGGLVVFPFLYLVGARRAFKASSRLWPWLAYPWLYFAVFAAANPLIFRWYLTPPLPVYFLIILAGLETLLAAALRIRGGVGGPPAWRKAVLLILLLVLPVGGGLSDWTLRPDHGPRRPAPNMAYIQLELLYRQAADLAAPRLERESVLAAGDVGVLGYYTPARILDTVGLNSPVALDYYPLDPRYYVINYAVAPALILDQQPDAVVILEVYGRLGLLESAQFDSLYEVYQIIPTGMYGSDGMLIFWKK